MTDDVALIAVLFAGYGLYQGIFRSVGKALATDFVPDRLRASGLGWYNATLGLMGLLASVVAGLLWDHVGHAAVFIYGAIFAVIASIAADITAGGTTHCIMSIGHEEVLSGLSLMSPSGTKRTCSMRRLMSAFGGKADISDRPADVHDPRKQVRSYRIGAQVPEIKRSRMYWEKTI
jgi:MFS family permease